MNMNLDLFDEADPSPPAANPSAAIRGCVRGARLPSPTPLLQSLDEVIRQSPFRRKTPAAI